MSKQLYSKPPLENTLTHLLQHRAHKEPEKVIYTWLQDGEHANRSLTYAELNSRALAIAGHLKAAGLERNRALLLFPPGLEFIEAFFGCLYAGMIAVPAYVPGTSRDH